METKTIRVLRYLYYHAVLRDHGWLRPAIGVVELSQSIIQAVPLSARKAGGGNSEGIAPFLQLPHFSEGIIKKVPRKDTMMRDLHVQRKSTEEIAASLKRAPLVPTHYCQHQVGPFSWALNTAQSKQNLHL